MLLMTDAKLMIFNVKPFRFPSYAFLSVLFQNVQKPFHTFLYDVGAFLLGFLFAFAHYFLGGSVAYDSVFHVVFAHLCAYGVQCLCIDIAA